MSLTIDHSTQRVKVNSPQQIVLMQDLLNAIRAEEASERGIAFAGIGAASGKEALGGGVYTAITVTLFNPWQIEFYASGTLYSAEIEGGNLVTERPDNDPFVLVPNVQIEITRSADATIVSGSGATPPSASEIATAVLAAAAITPIAVNVKKINDALVYGNGSDVNPWREAP